MTIWFPPAHTGQILLTAIIVWLISSEITSRDVHQPAWLLTHHTSDKPEKVVVIVVAVVVR